MTQEDERRPSGADSRRIDRLLGGAAESGPPPAPRRRSLAPPAVRRAALVVALEAALLVAAAVLLLVLTVTSTPDSLGRAVAEVVLVGALGAGVAAAARALWRGSLWSRGPVIAVQVFLAIYGFSTTFQLERPLFGVPALVLVGVTLYLLATPEARLAFEEQRDPS